MVSAYSSLIRALPELYEAHALDTLPRHLLNWLSKLVPADVAAYNEVNLKRPSLDVIMNPPELNRSEYVQRLAHFIRIHPIVRHQRETGDISARKISDFLSRSRYHRTPLYQEVYRHLEGEDQMALTLRMTRHTVVALAMNRGRRSFTEEDREMLNLLQPHLTQVYRNARALTALKRRVADKYRAFDALPVPLIVLDQRLRIKSSTEPARALLRRYFPATSRDVLPEALRSWLLQKRCWHGASLPNVIADFSQPGVAGRLSVRCIRAASGNVVLAIEEYRVPESIEPLRRMGLTAREAEILLWVARGKSNPEIGIILGSAARTVQKHLEHVFEKLGVATRTDAARRALEAFSPGLYSI